MPSNRTKYSEEMRNETATYIIETGKSATSMAGELGIGINTICRWTREYRRKHNLPTYAFSIGVYEPHGVQIKI